MIDLNATNVSRVSGCANQGLDIAKDLDGSMHFKGAAVIDEINGAWSKGLTSSKNSTKSLGVNAWVDQH